MKKLSLVIMVFLFLTTILAACGGGNSEQHSGSSDQPAVSSASSASAEPSQSAPAKKVTLDLWVLTDGQDSAMKTVAEDYKKINPNVEIKITSHATDPHKEALKVAAASGTLPDMWFNWGGSLGSYFPENGFTLDLTQYAKEHNWDSEFVKSALDLSTFNGQLSGVPWHIFGMGIWYRKDIFQKYGLQVPKTFEEFENVMKTVKENKITPLTTGGKGGWHPMRLLEGILEHYTGVEEHNKLMSMQDSWDNNAVVKTYQKWKEWNDLGYFPKGFLTLDPSEAKFPLYKGQAAMILEGPWFDGVLNTDQQDPNLYGFFPLPTDQSPTRISSFVEMFQINKKSAPEVQQAALAFAEYITSAETVKNHGDVLGAPQARINAPVSDKLPHVKQIVDALNTGGYLVTDQALPQEIVQKFFQAQDSVITGEMTPEAATKFMEQEVQKYKAKGK